MVKSMREPKYQKPAIEGQDGSAARPAVVVFRRQGLVVTRVDRADFGVRGVAGHFDYIYWFATYELQTAGACYRPRRYADEWHRVSLFAPGGQTWPAIPYSDSDFARVVRYFAGLDDVTTVHALISDSETPYQPVDPSRLGGGVR
jgi:hypothetical protein